MGSVHDKSNVAAAAAGLKLVYIGGKDWATLRVA
jgi:hypothetical protein